MRTLWTSAGEPPHNARLRTTLDVPSIASSTHIRRGSESIGYRVTYPERNSTPYLFLLVEGRFMLPHLDSNQKPAD